MMTNSHRVMSRAEKRIRLIILSCEIDHAIADAASLMTDLCINPKERDQAEENLRFFRHSLERVEAMLSADSA